ncbi:carbon-nitrogen hydrolase [Amniculicola lignicola CBS 123094]|uniref:Carbon-nitrogen hydrolase n=1 Tax=Amniculicola lignicola CBS 123094 TaxID=1392246 RepID=A0A6A5W648_9PLEO|nr:carbon-nitrogen hydrolase [Amniculicola lignicola CBS 123094]
MDRQAERLYVTVQEHLQLSSEYANKEDFVKIKNAVSLLQKTENYADSDFVSFNFNCENEVLKLASAQTRTLTTTVETLQALEDTTKQAAAQGVDIILFPEAYLGGYPRSCGFGSVVGSRSEEGREQFLRYFKEAVDLGDTPQGAGNDWVDRKLPLARGKDFRGDGTREELERIARETGVFIITGIVEKSGGTLYCDAVYVCPRYGILGKRRKVMPTGSERLVWGQGSPSTLKAVATEIKGVRVVMASAICWENYMPLLRQSLYAQNVNLWLAPTADARDAWTALMRTVGVEGRCWVLGSNQCVRKKDLPAWITRSQPTGSSSNAGIQRDDGEEQDVRVELPLHAQHGNANGRVRRKSIITFTEDKHEICWPLVEKQKEALENGDIEQIDEEPLSPISPNRSPHPLKTVTTLDPDATSQATTPPIYDAAGEEFACRGGSIIVSPFGDVVAGPVWEAEDELLVFEADFEDCDRGRLDMDVAGSYSRSDAFHLTVDGLDLNPPP